MINIQYLLGGAENVMHQIAGGIRARGVSCALALPTLGRTLCKPPHVELLYPRLINRLSYTRFSAVIERLFALMLYHHRRLAQMATFPVTMLRRKIPRLAACMKLRPMNQRGPEQ
jgi:hypothetical protein